MTDEMRALGLGLVGIAAACGSAAHEPISGVAGCAGLGAQSGSPLTAGTGAQPSGGASATGGFGGAAGLPDVEGGDGGTRSDAAEAGAGGEVGQEPAGKTLIAGVVVGADELPVANATVQAQGHRVTTGANGVFQLRVDPPYDLVVFEPKLSPLEEPDVAEPRAYLGLTRTQLKLAVRTLSRRSTQLSGTVTGRLATPAPTLGLVYGHVTQYLAEYTLGANGHYALTAPAWQGSAPLPALLIAAQADPQPDPEAPFVLNSFAARSVDLTAGSAAQLDLTLAKPTFHELAFEVTQPAGQAFDDCDITVALAGAFELFFQYGCQPVSRTIAIPDGIPDGVLRVSAHGFSTLNSWEYEVSHTIAPAATTFTVPIPPTLPTIDSPVDQSTLPSRTGKLAYSLGSNVNALALLKLCFPDWKAKRMACANIYTAETTLPLERLLRLAMGTAASGYMTLEVQAVPSLKTTDELTSPSRFEADGSWLYRNYLAAPRSFNYTAD